MNLKKAAILQPFLSIDGRSRVALAVVELLNQHGIVPDIFAYDALDSEIIHQGFGQSLQYNLILIGNKKMTRWGAYYLNYWLAKIRSYLAEYDLVFNSSNYWAPLPATVNCIHYIHFPAFAWEDVYQEGGMLKRVYWFLLKFLHLNYSPKSNHTFLVNSSFTRQAMLSSLKKKGPEYNTKVVYPPVNVDAFWSKRSVFERIPTVATLGRFMPRKKQLMQIQLAKKFRGLDFFIMGQVNSPNSQKYFERCQSLVAELELQNVHFYVNCDFKTIVEKMDSSRFFLHTMDKEHFGISTVEGIASGCIPIVPDSGGQVEIVPLAEQRFRDFDDAKNVIRRLQLLPVSELESRRVILQEHIKLFSLPEFKRMILEEIDLFK